MQLIASAKFFNRLITFEQLIVYQRSRDLMNTNRKNKVCMLYTSQFSSDFERIIQHVIALKKFCESHNSHQSVLEMPIIRSQVHKKFVNT